MGEVLAIDPRDVLRRFLDRRGISATAFGRLLHVSRQAVSAWLCGRDVPSRPTRVRIEQLTEGEIQAIDWETSKEREVRHRLVELQRSHGLAATYTPRTAIVRKQAALP